jgi:hypothetical protein
MIIQPHETAATDQIMLQRCRKYLAVVSEKNSSFGNFASLLP